ncbi:hypothetical protein SRB5_63970 [Streptomyces sp. RB5]|uniref:Uncharacterized protein n=1 Tax=Streptomyces smaragdinus TaxID=2585196 RepID=A0A7K0CRY5_9ACTN|nr:hypothetical protein [Streptomyces smaragdinus]
MRRRRGGLGEIPGQVLVGALVVGGLIGALFFGMPAMETGQGGAGTAQTGTSRP